MQKNDLLKIYINKLTIILILCLFTNFSSWSNISALEVERSTLQAIPDNTSVVYNLAEFKLALTSPTITTIYLGADITLDINGPLISPDKPFLIIDGMNPYAEKEEDREIVHRLTEYNSSTAAVTPRIEKNGTLKDIRIQNMKITGYNYYGVICIYDIVTNVYMTLDNVYYEGPQPVYNNFGTTHFKNTTLLLGSGYAGTFGEAAESANVILEGDVQIKQVITNNVLSVFGLIYKLPGGIDGNITILPDSNIDVTVNNLSYFMYMVSGSGFKVGKNAKFTFNGSSRFWLGTAPKAITIDEGAEVYIDLANNNLNATLSSTGNVTVKKDAVLQIISKSNTTYPLLSLGGSFILQDPKSVVLSRPNGNPLHYLEAKTLVIEAQQVNYWTTISNGNPGDKPLYLWSKSDGSNIMISGSVALGGNLSSISHNYHIEQDATDLSQQRDGPSTDTFRILDARTIAIGRHTITAEYKYSEEMERVHGVTSPDSVIELLKYSDLINDYLSINSTVTNTPDYIITSPENLNTSKIKIRSYIPYFAAQYLFTATTELFEVTFETNGGTNISPIMIGKGEKIRPNPYPIKDGYNFEGWYKDAELTTKWDFHSDTVNSDITLYAGWTSVILHSVNFHYLRESTGVPIASSASEYYEEGEFVDISDIQKAIYKPKYYTINNDLTQYPIDQPFEVTIDMTIQIYFYSTVIEVEVPIQMLFSAFESGDGVIVSPEYEICNFSDLPLTVSLSEVKTDPVQLKDLDLSVVPSAQDEGDLQLDLISSAGFSHSIMGITPNTLLDSYGILGTLDQRTIALGCGKGSITIGGKYMGPFTSQYKQPKVIFTFHFSIEYP